MELVNILSELTPPSPPFPLHPSRYKRLGKWSVFFLDPRTWGWWPLNEGSTVFHITALDLAFTNTAKEINHFNIVKIVNNNC